MHIQTLPIEAAPGHVLVHNVVDETGKKVLKKGTLLGQHEVATLRALDSATVEVAVLAEDDVREDEAASRIAAALCAGQDADTLPLRATRAAAGRVNLHVEGNGVLHVDTMALYRLNSLPGVTLATLPAFAPLGPLMEKSQLATLKIIPYALPGKDLSQAVALARGLLRVLPMAAQRVALLVTADDSAAERFTRQFEAPTRERLTRLGSSLETVEHVPLDEAAIAAAAARLLAEHDALIIGGQTSIMDRDDTTPRALARIGAEIALHGAPVEPGNLLALAYHGARWILLAPGCAKSLAPNVVDLVLPRLLSGERLGQADVGALGLGGLL